MGSRWREATRREAGTVDDCRWMVWSNASVVDERETLKKDRRREKKLGDKMCGGQLKSEVSNKEMEP